MEFNRESQFESARPSSSPLIRGVRNMAMLAFLASGAAACSTVHETDNKTQQTDAVSGDSSTDLPGDTTVINNTLCPDDQQPKIYQKISEAVAMGVFDSCINCHKAEAPHIGWQPNPQDPSKTVGWELDLSGNPAKRLTSFQSITRVAAKRSDDGKKPWILAHTQDNNGSEHGGGFQNFDGPDGIQTTEITQLSDEALQWLHDTGKTDVSQLVPSDYPPLKADCDASAFTEEMLFSGVKLRTLAETYDKFVTDVCGLQSPTQDANIQTEAQLQQFVLQAMENSPEYLKFLRTTMNDQTLTRGLAKDPIAIKNLGDNLGLDLTKVDPMDAADLANLRFAWIAKNHRNAREWFNGSYILDPGVKPLTGPDEVMDRLTPKTISDDLTPVVGFITDGFLLRFPTTDSNKHRGDVYIELKLDYDLDVLANGVRVLPPADSTEPDPTNKLEACRGCHVATPLDLFARLHAKFDNKTGKFLPNATEPFPISQVNNALYGKQLPHNATTGLRTGVTLLTMDPDLPTSDPNYDPKRVYPTARSAVKALYQGLVQRKALPEPKLTDANLAARQAAFNVENAAIDKWAHVYHNSNGNINATVAAIVASKFYRATESMEGNADLTADERIEKGSVGSTLATVETMAHRFSVLLGPEAKNFGFLDKLKKQYNMELMDIDSLAVTVRSHDPTSAYELRLKNLALNDIAQIVIKEFSKKPEDRYRFKGLGDLDTVKSQVPIDLATGTTNTAVEQNYKNEIALILHDAFHKTYTVDDPAVQQWYNEWVRLYKIGATHDQQKSLAASVQVPGMDPSDKNCILRTWIALLAEITMSEEFNYTQKEKTPNETEVAQKVEETYRLITTFSQADLLAEKARFQTLNNLRSLLRANVARVA